MDIGELLPHLFVWVTFLGIAVAEKEDAHLGISLFVAPRIDEVNKDG